MTEMIILSISNIICFFLGASIRQKVDTKAKIETPKLPNIKEKIDNRRIEKEQKIEQEKYQRILENINNYPGNQSKID